MNIKIAVRAGADDAFIAWEGPFIPDCRGFALYRRVRRGESSAPSPHRVAEAGEGFVDEIVSSWVGFADDAAVEAGTREPTTIWPIQKYLWSDFTVNAGDRVAYRVVPMLGTRESLRPDEAKASTWSETVVVGADARARLSCYFNRGVVAAQWLSRLLPKDADPKLDTRLKNAKLREIIGSPGDPVRDFLSGPIREKMLALLDDADAKKRHVYAALFELDDPELIERVKAFRKRAHLLLGNGSVKHKGDDANAEARESLEGICDIRNRMSAPRALAHNKFLVICDDDKQPAMVWTGSTNWSMTGLCTQANNGVLVKSASIAAEYLAQWKALAEVGDATPETLRESNDIPRRAKNVTLWFTPLPGQDDLAQARELIMQARQGILFVMFNPGPRGSLLNDIIEIASPAGEHFNPELYIQGVVNQNPGTAANPVTLFNRGKRIDANADVVLPAAIDEPSKFFVRELKRLDGTFAMAHSKVVVVDPFGDHPVVITGSHNLGPKASGVNDENLLIIQKEPLLASQYATKIMELYNQYRWRSSQQDTPQEKRWTGLADDDRWQIGRPDANAESAAYDRRRLRELDFWFGR